MQKSLHLKTKVLIALLFFTTITIPSWGASLTSSGDIFPNSSIPNSLETLGKFNFEPNKEIFYSDDRLEVYSAYPNPVSGTAFIDYQIFQSNIQAQIVVTDVLGNMMNKYPLIYSQNQIRIQTQSFTTGVYFYTLSVDGKVMATKKLVVKKS